LSKISKEPFPKKDSQAYKFAKGNSRTPGHADEKSAHAQTLTTEQVENSGNLQKSVTDLVENPSGVENSTQKNEKLTEQIDERTVSELVF
jgi:hypothetical protein